MASDIDIDRFAVDTGDDVIGDDVMGGHGHVVRGGTPIVRDSSTARLTSSTEQVGDYFDDA